MKPAAIQVTQTKMMKGLVCCFVVGGSASLFEGFMDVFPLAVVWFILMASVTWGALQLYVGARLIGPLGICMAWAIYQVMLSLQRFPFRAHL